MMDKGLEFIIHKEHLTTNMETSILEKWTKDEQTSHRRENSNGQSI